MNAKGPVMVYSGGGGPRSSAGEAHLWVCSGKNIGRRFALDKPNMVIGRSSTADIPVVDDRVSQQHAVVETRDDGHFLRDLGSTNGTFVNNQRTREASLRDGDLIQVGETVFEYLSYQERNLTITLRGTNGESDSVPAALRSEARQALENARISGEHDIIGSGTPAGPVGTGPIGTGPIGTAPGGTAPPGTHPPGSPGNTIDVTASNPIVGQGPMHTFLPSIQRPARDVGPAPYPHHPTHPGGATYPNSAVPLPVPYTAPGYGTQAPHSMVPMGPHGMPLAPPQYEERSAALVNNGEEEGGGITLEMILARLSVAKDIFGPTWKLILLMMVVGVGLGILAFKKNPPLQTAEFEIALHARTLSNPLSPYAGRLRRFFVAAEAAFKTDELIEKTLVELGHPEPEPELLNRTGASLELVSAGPPTPDTYTGTFKDRDGDWALNFLETHVRLYLESEVEKGLKVLKAEAGFLQEQVGEVEKQLRRTEAEVMEFKKQHLGVTPGTNDAYSRLLALEMEESRAIMQLSKARKTRGMLQGRLRTEQPLVKTRLRYENHFQKDIKDVELQLLREQSAGKGPDHPQIIALTKRLGELKAKAEANKDDPSSFETSRNPVYTSIQNEERQMKVQEQLAEQQLAYVRRELVKVKKIVADLPELEAAQAELMRSYKTTKDQYEKLLQKLQVVQVQLNLERAAAAAKYEVISEPHLVYMPRGKKMAIYGAAGMAGGFAFGVFLAVLLWAIRTGKVAALRALLKGQRGEAVVANEAETALAPVEHHGGEMAPPPHDHLP